MTSVVGKCLQALQYLRAHPGARCSQVGYALYGGGVGHKSNRAREGGSILSRLVKSGYARWDWSADGFRVCYLTTSGHEVVEGVEKS